MTKPRLSVLLPNYNNEGFLKKCLDSLFNQTFQDFVLYFVDDCSSDNSLKVVESYDQSKIILIKKDKNSGIVDTLNEGLKRVDTEYFIRLDGDDANYLDRFEKMVAFMDQNPDIDVCGSALKTFGCREDVQTYPLDPNVNKANLIFGHSLCHPSCIFRARKFKENHILYTNDFYRLEDYSLFYRTKDLAKCANIEDITYLYRQEEYNYNPELFVRMSQEYLKFYKMILGDLFEDVTDGEAKIHLELSGKIPPTLKFTDFKNHVQRILESNKIKNAFPQDELQKILDNKLLEVAYKLVDGKELRLSDLKGFSHLTKLKLTRYFLGSRLNSKAN